MLDGKGVAHIFIFDVTFDSFNWSIKYCLGWYFLCVFVVLFCFLSFSMS